ncbi:indole-3-glycerol phosphate synthase TrpC [Arthrobacter sp. TMN-37]
MSVLDDIISGVREDLSLRAAGVPLAEVRARALEQAPAADALAALRGDGRALQVIAEVKRSSPSKGRLAPIADPAALAARYEAGGAAVVSVLTEQRRFNGSLADLDAVRASVRIPVLRKDFTVEDYQIWEARAHGADLVLLIVAALGDAQLEHFLGLTHELGMNALVETHTAEEVDRAAALDARILGVNVRNLKTLEIDRSVFADLAGRIPEHAVTVAESGVRTVADVEEFAALGAQAVLVGEALVRGEDPEAAVAQFRAVGTRDRSGLRQR